MCNIKDQNIQDKLRCKTLKESKIKISNIRSLSVRKWK